MIVCRQEGRQIAAKSTQVPKCPSAAKTPPKVPSSQAPKCRQECHQGLGQGHKGPKGMPPGYAARIAAKGSGQGQDDRSRNEPPKCRHGAAKRSGQGRNDDPRNVPPKAPQNAAVSAANLSDTAWYSTASHSTAGYSTAWYSTARYSTVWHNTPRQGYGLAGG